MSENIKNEWIDWIEEAITKEYFKYYDYSQFSDVNVIGTGGFGKVYRANWKNSKYLALKSFSNFNNATAKEVVHELKLQRDVDFHNNIISFYGITGIVHRDLHSGESYDVSLVVEISQGHRETVVPNTPEEYSKLYIECWDVIIL
ncbi:unnamed protein product [Rhizophagus irregularis]|nr:unnamed protein product [Rhizophagus irregularis]